MKRVLTTFMTISSIALLMLSSCKKDETKVVANSGKAGSLSASSTTIALDKTKLTDNAVTFTASAANFGYKAAVSNILQVDVNGDNFANAKEYNLPTNTLTQSFTVLDFNNLMLKLNLPTGVASQVQARIKSQIGNTITPVYSNTLALTVTPFALISYIYVPGAYQGWNPSTADSLVSPTNNGVYSGIIHFTAGNLDYKITPAKKWDVAYGDAGSGKVSTSGGNLTAPGAGNVKINLDLNKNTIEMVPTQWGIIGDATAGSWDTDTDMSYDNGKQTWTVTATLKAGGLKFRLNHDWGVNLGGSNGTLSLNGANISIADAGSYVITLDAVANTYTLTKQ